MVRSRDDDSCWRRLLFSVCVLPFWYGCPQQDISIQHCITAVLVYAIEQRLTFLHCSSQNSDHAAKQGNADRNWISKASGAGYGTTTSGIMCCPIRTVLFTPVSSLCYTSMQSTHSQSGGRMMMPLRHLTLESLWKTIQSDLFIQ